MSGSPPSLFLPYLGLFPSQSQVFLDCGIHRVLLVVCKLGWGGDIWAFLHVGDRGQDLSSSCCSQEKTVLAAAGKDTFLP